MVDEHGEVYSPTRQINDVKAKEIKDFIEDIGTLPNVEEAKAIQSTPKEEIKPVPTPEEIAKLA